MKITSIFMMFLSLAIFAVGCDTSSSNEEDDHGDDHGDHDHGDHDHDHGTTGKHGGHIIEIGRDHAYHAEFVDDHDKEMVIVYMLDGKLNAVNIDTESISAVVTAEGNTKSFDLAAASSGGASEFSSNDAELLKMLDHDHVTIKLRINIDGKPHTGSYDHHGHDHDDHDHDDDDHEH